MCECGGGGGGLAKSFFFDGGINTKGHRRQASLAKLSRQFAKISSDQGSKEGIYTLEGVVGDGGPK